MEERAPGHFVPCSTRHLIPDSVQPETDLPLQCLCNVTSQQAVKFNSDVVGHCSSQQSDEELEQINSAISTVLRDLHSAGYCNGSTDSTVHGDKGSEDGASSVDSMCDSEVDTDPDIDFFSGRNIKIGADGFGTSKQTSCYNIDSNQIKSTFNRSIVVENWRADDNVANNSNARVAAHNSVDKCKPSSQTPSQSGQVNCDQSDINEGHSVDSQPLCSQSSSKQHLTADRQSSETQNSIDEDLSNTSASEMQVVESRQSSRGKKHRSYKTSGSTVKTVKWNDDEKAGQVNCDQSDISEGHSVDSQPLCSQSSSKQHLTAGRQSSETQNSVDEDSSNTSASETQVVKSQSSRGKKHRSYKTSGSTVKWSDDEKAAALQVKKWQVRNVSKRCSLFEYKQELLYQQNPVHCTDFIRQAYCCIAERWGMSFVRHIRGDNFAAVRAILYQALVNNFLQCKFAKFEDSCLKLHVFSDTQNRFLHGWNFANRIPYGVDTEVEVLAHCLEELHGVIEAMSSVPTRMIREDYLMCFLNRNPDVDIRLLESVKFIMMEKALCVYHQIQRRKQQNWPPAAECWLFSSWCPEQLFWQRINPLGDSVKAGPMEFQLLGYALGINIEVIQPSLFNSCDFVTRYLCEGIRSTDNLCIVIEENNEYCVLTA